jgi:hypothetical protein
MSQKDTTSQKKATPGGTGKRGSTKYRMQAMQEENGKVTGEMKSPFAPADLAPKTSERPPGEANNSDSVRGLWKSKVLASYHGSGSQPHNGPDVSEQDYADAVHEAMISIIDRIFDIFQNSAYEFNKIAAGSELELNWVRPFLTKEGAPSWMGSNVEPVTVFTGRMSTRLWTLIMKGTTDMVQTFILPTSKLMTFNMSSSTFKPYLQLEPHFDNGVLGWRLDHHNISPSLIQPIARELFNGLLRFAKNECRDDEEFDLVNIGLVAPKPVEDPQVEIERQRYYQQAFLEDLKSHLDTRRDVRPADNPQSQRERSGPPPSEFNQPLPEHIRKELEFLRGNTGANMVPQMPPGDGASSPANWKTMNGEPAEKLDTNIARQLHRMAEDATGLTQANGQNPFGQAPQARSPQGQQPTGQGPNNGHLQQPPHQQPPHQQPQQLQHPQQPQQPLMPPRMSPPPQPIPNPNPNQQQQQHQMQRPGNAAPAPTQEHMAQVMAAAQNAAQSPARQAAPVNLPAALSLLIQSLEREMEVVAKAGADAFALRDLGRADAALKFSARLADYKQMSQELLEYYRRKR